MPGMAQGAHRGRPVAAAPCTPGLRPAKSPLRGPFDLSLQASGRAEAASVQNTALSPHPCGLPRPSGNVSAILRPSAPAVSATMVNILTTGRTNVGRVRRSRHPAQNRLCACCHRPVALRLPGLRGMSLGEDPVGRVSVAPPGKLTAKQGCLEGHSLTSCLSSAKASFILSSLTTKARS